MKMLAADKKDFDTNHPGATRASSRTVVLVAVSFILGIAFTWGWYLHKQRSGQTSIAGVTTASVVLSDSTKAVLQRLESPVEIRLYSPADTADLPAAILGFVSRVEQLLAEYDRVADGKVRVVRSDPYTDTAAKSAAGAAGMLPSSGTDGRIYYLGLAVMCGKYAEVMPRLAPEWEAALESDLSRAILRVSAPAVSPDAPVAQAMAEPTPIDPAISEALVKMIPDFDLTTFDDAAKILREATLDELKSATIEMRSNIQAAQLNLAEAREKKSVHEQENALKEFQHVQTEQAEKLKQITARLQERIIVLQRLKNSGMPAVPAK